MMLYDITDDAIIGRKNIYHFEVKKIGVFKTELISNIEKQSR